MAKFYGEVGYVESVETSPGVWADEVTKRMYYGDVTHNTRMLQSGDKLSDDINISNIISIVSDPFADKNFHLIKYVEYMGEKWKVSNVEVSHPRLILTLGGLYNGK